ncbi:MAG: hypothetical protein ACK41T_12530 [Pseudobdellovibrio sp.]
MLRCLLVFVITLWIGFFSYAQKPENKIELGKLFSSSYERMLVDARGSRGGNGDVAAAYLTISDFLINYQIQSDIIILVDENAKTRFLNLAVGNREVLNKVKILTLDEIPKNKFFDFYMVLANPSGSYRYKADFEEKIKFSKDATYIVQTVLGNTENTSSIHPYATVEHDGLKVDWSPAGMAFNEAGIYSDYIAQKLVLMQDRQEVLSFIHQHLNEIQDAESFKKIEYVLFSEVFKKSQVGLVYGISAEQTQKQFEKYLQGLVNTSFDRSYTLITPSSFDINKLSDVNLKKHIVHIKKMSDMPKDVQSGRVYIVETKTLPHSVFVSLMALSHKNKMTPVGAGDGFLSAAIELGIPFVLTRVPWNAANIQNLKDMLYKLILSSSKVPSGEVASFKLLLEENYERLDFRRANDLYRYTPIYKALSRGVKRLSNSLMKMSLNAKDMRSPEKLNFDDHIFQHNYMKKYREQIQAIESKQKMMSCVNLFAS